MKKFNYGKPKKDIAHHSLYVEDTRFHVEDTSLEIRGTLFCGEPFLSRCDTD
jgi:hypothetical protein